MSTVTETEMKTETPERAFLVREFAAELTPGDGRTVDVRIVPYGERIRHNDGHGGLPPGVFYSEEWVPGAFSAQDKAAHRVLVNVEHDPSFVGVVGHGLTLREQSDGYYGSFTIHDTPEGNKALMLINQGVYDHISLEARPLKSIRTLDGVIQRVKAHLRNISLTRYGAYEGARVLAVREEEIEDEFVIESHNPDPELLERCRALGITLPQRYEAHPVETDTSAESDTSADGTRRPESMSSSEEDA